MPTENPDASKQPKVRATQTNSAHLYGTPSDALKAVREDYHYWTGKLTDSSFELSVAVIGVNWAVFSSVAGILGNPWAQVSISAVIVGLGINLIGAKILGEMHRERIDYAELSPERWQREYQDTLGENNPWPYTKAIERLARFLRECKTWAPIFGGAMFMIALITSQHKSGAAEKLDNRLQPAAAMEAPSTKSTPPPNKAMPTSSPSPSRSN